MSPNVVSLLILAAAVAFTIWQIQRSRHQRDAPAELAASTEPIDSITYYWRPG